MAVDVGRVFALLAAKGTEEARAASCGHSSRQGLPRGPGTGNVRGADAGLRGETAGGPPLCHPGTSVPRAPDGCR